MSRVGGGVSTQREARAQDTADLSSTLQYYIIMSEDHMTSLDHSCHS